MVRLHFVEFGKSMKEVQNNFVTYLHTIPCRCITFVFWFEIDM